MTRLLYINHGKSSFFSHNTDIFWAKMAGKATGIVVGKDGCENDTFTGNETLSVNVQDTSLMDARAKVLGEQTISLQAGQTFPIDYSVDYDQEKANQLPEYGFTLSARIEDPSGKLLYINDTRTSARGDKIEVKKIVPFKYE